MNSVVHYDGLIPGFVSVLLFLVFTYLHEQSRQPYFRAWQLAWAAYSLHYILDTFPKSSIAFFYQRAFSRRDGTVHFRSTRLMRGFLSVPLVRRRRWHNRRRSGLPHTAGSHRQRCVSSGTYSQQFAWA